MQPLKVTLININLIDEPRRQLLLQNQEPSSIEQMDLKIEFSYLLQHKNHSIVDQMALFIDNFIVDCTMHHSVLIFARLSDQNFVDTCCQFSSRGSYRGCLGFFLSVFVNRDPT